MKRRKILKNSSKLVVASGALVLAGCSSVFGGLEIVESNSEVTNFGNIVVRVLVNNSGSSSATATLVGQVDIQDGDTYTESRSITVLGGESNTYILRFDISLGDTLSGNMYEYSVWLE